MNTLSTVSPTNRLLGTQMTQKYLNVTEEQTANFMIGGRGFLLRLYPFRKLMYMDLTEGDNVIFSGKRVIQNRWILPAHIAQGVGNLRFETYPSDKNDYVWWDGFNTKFRLMVYTFDELPKDEEEDS